MKLTEDQYAELSQFWHEFMVLGPTREQMGLDLNGIALTFSQWIDSDEDYPEYGLPEIHAFFHEKELREGTAWPKDYRAPTESPNPYMSDQHEQAYWAGDTTGKQCDIPECPNTA